jgi:hypothetical protein
METTMAEETPNPTPWFETFDPDIKGHLQNKGWDKLDPVAAAAAAAKAHHAAERHIGNKTPSRPDTPDGYDFSKLKLDPGLEAQLREVAHKANMSPQQALELTQTFTGFIDAKAEKSTAEMQSMIAADAARLKQNWGANFENNMLAARRAADRLGVTPEAVAALEKTGGYSSVMEMMRQLDVAMGEARVITGSGGPQWQSGLMPADQAAARINELKKRPGLVQTLVRR